MRQEAVLSFQLPPSLTYHLDGSLILRLLPRRPAAPFQPCAAEALRWWDMLAVPGSPSSSTRGYDDDARVCMRMTCVARGRSSSHSESRKEKGGGS